MRDLVSIALAKGILGTVANILAIAQVRSHKLRSDKSVVNGSAESVIKNKPDFLVIIQVDKCDIIKRVLERGTEDAAEDDLRGPLGILFLLQSVVLWDH